MPPTESTPTPASASAALGALHTLRQQAEARAANPFAPVEDRPFSQTLFTKLKDVGLSVGKNWIKNLDPRGKDNAWRLGVVLGAAESVAVGWIPLGPANGLIKAGLNMAASQVVYAGARAWYAQAEKQAASTVEATQEDYSYISNASVRAALASGDRRIQPSTEIQERRTRTNQRIRNFFLGLSAGSTYLSATGIVMSAAGVDYQTVLHDFTDKFSHSVSGEQAAVIAGSDTTPPTTPEAQVAADAQSPTAPAVPSETPSPTESPTVVPSPTHVPDSPTVTSSPTSADSPTVTVTDTPTAAETATSTATTTSSPTASITPTAEATAPPTQVATAPSPSETPVPTPIHPEPPAAATATVTAQATPPTNGVAPGPDLAAAKPTIVLSPETELTAAPAPAAAAAGLNIPHPPSASISTEPPQAAFEPRPPVATAATAKEALDKLLSADPELAKAPAHFVGENIDQTNTAAREALSAAGIDSSQLSDAAYEKVRAAVQHKLEEQANASIAKTAENLAANGSADLTQATDTARAIFEQSFDPASGAHKELLDAAKSVLTDQQAVHDHLLNSVAAEISKPGEVVAEVALDRGSTVGQMLVEHGYDFTSWGTDNADVLGAHIAANYDLLNDTWGNVASAGNFPEGMHFPVGMEELNDLIDKAKGGDAQALQQLKDALHWLPANKSFKILNKSAIGAIIQTIKK